MFCIILWSPPRILIGDLCHNALLKVNSTYPVDLREQICLRQIEDRLQCSLQMRFSTPNIWNLSQLFVKPSVDLWTSRSTVFFKRRSRAYDFRAMIGIPRSLTGEGGARRGWSIRNDEKWVKLPRGERTVVGLSHRKFNHMCCAWTRSVKWTYSP